MVDEVKKQQQDKSQIQTKPTQGSVSEVREFLESINLQQYEQRLADAGADSLDILREMKKQDLQEVGIPKGHIVKILKYLQKGQPQEQSSTVSTASRVPNPDNSIKAIDNQPPAVTKCTTSAYDSCQTEQNGVLSTKRLFCQSCFLPFSSPSLGHQPFCSKTCLQNYRRQNFVQCSGCSVHYQKWNCFKHDDSYFCSEACLRPRLEQLERPIGVPTSDNASDHGNLEPIEQNQFYLLEQEQQSGELPVDLNEFLEMQRYLRTPE